MKKLILLLALAFVMCGCIPGIPDKPYSVVTKVEKSESQYYTISYKYVVTTDNNFRFYTDETFYVGDTIQITKKNYRTMTRDREIELKAEQNTTNQLELEGYIKGAIYADQHPRKGLWDAEKVVEWILNNYETYEQTYSDNSGNHTYSDFQIGQFIRNLRKAMEE